MSPTFDSARSWISAEERGPHRVVGDGLGGGDAAADPAGPREALQRAAERDRLVKGGRGHECIELVYTA